MREATKMRCTIAADNAVRGVFRPRYRQPANGKPWLDGLSEHSPTCTLDRTLAEFEREYDARHGKGAWQRKVNEDWERVPARVLGREG